MKILYIAHERSDAVAGANALRRMAPDVAVAWTSRLEDAAHWILENQDVAALVLEAQVGTQTSGSFLKHVRRLGLTAPAIVLTPAGAGVPVDLLNAGADDHLPKNQALLRDLPVAVRRAIDRPRPAAATAAPRPSQAKAELRETPVVAPPDARQANQAQFATVMTETAAARDALARKLAEAQAAVERAERARASDAAAAADQLAQRSQAFTVSLAEVIHSRDALEQRLGETGLTLERARRDRESEAAAASERQAALEARLDQEAANRIAAERSVAAARQKLREAEAALENAEARHAAEAATAAAQLVEHQARHDAELAQVAAVRDGLEHKVAELALALQRAEEMRAANEATASTLAERSEELSRLLEQAQHDYASSSLVVKRLTQRETDLSGALAEAASIREMLERGLADAEAAFSEAEARATSDLRAAAGRQADLEARLDRLRDDRDALEERLTNAEAARQRAEEEYTSDMAAAAAQFAERHAQDEIRLAIAATAAADKLAHREQELGARLAEIVAERDMLSRRQADTEAALQTAHERGVRERLHAAEQSRRREAEFEALLKQEADTRRAVEDALARVERVRQDAAEQHASALATATAQIAEGQARLEAERTHAAAVQDGLRRKLSEAEAVGERARRDHASAAAAVDQLTRRETELGALLAAATANASALERRLADAEQARREADEAATRDRLAAAEEAALRQADLEARLGQEIDKRRVVDERLSHSEAAGRAADERHAAAVDQLTRRETELGALLAAATANASALERRLADAEQARREADEAATRDRLAAAEEAALRQADFEARLDRAALLQADLQAQLARSRDEHRLLEERLAHEQAARSRAEERHALDMAAASDQFAERHAQDEIRLAVAAAEAAGRLAQRERELGDELAGAAAAYDDLERRLAEAQQARRQADEGAERDRLAAAEQAAQRQAAFEAQLDEARDERHVLEERLANAEIARRDAEARHASEMTTVTAQFADRQARLESELMHAATAREALDQRTAELDAALTRARRDLESHAGVIDRLAGREAELSALLAESTATCEALELQRVGAERSFKAAEERATRERLAAMEREAEVAARLADETDRRKSLEQELAETRLAAEASQRLYLEEIAGVTERAREQAAELVAGHARDRADYESRLAAMQEQVRELDALVAERNAQLKDLTARHSASEQAAKHAFTQLQDGFQSALSAHGREVEQLQAQLGAAARELEATCTHRDILRTEAEQIPQLQRELDGLRTEMQRQFVQHPQPLCRCTRDGVITHVNRAFAAMVGCPVVDLQRAVNVASTLFQATDDLSWLVERCLGAGTAGPIELTWRSEDGTRLFVRLSAMATPDGIEIVAQDITPHRAMQDRLAQAQRMEAVGRLASEVAVTCGNLLKDVSQNGQRWLAALDGNTAVQHQGEMLLGEVTRAASFLRQLAAYGEEQTSALEPVDLHRVLRNLEPVLKEVAGDDIELVLPESPPRSSPPFHVDLRAERVERLLVNVASYGRERMPLGGSLIFDLAPAVVDRQFIEKYPNVRQGPHVLLTVTEARGAVRSIGPHGFREELAEAHDAPAASERPGVDLGALQRLVRECGGHLWMEAAPPGDMVIKIHLPLRAQDESTREEPQTTGQSRGPLGRWFHH